MKIAEARTIPLDELREAEWNPNRVGEQTMSKLVRSVEEFGFVENLVARPHPTEEGAYELLSGNHRLRVLKLAGHTEASVVVVELDDVQARLLAQTMNRTRGRDDPLVYRHLINDLLGVLPVSDITALLPETAASIEFVLGEADIRHVDIPPIWGVIVDCVDGDDEAALLKRFTADGRPCRPLVETGADA